MNYFGQVKRWVGEITEISLLLAALGVVVQILFGEAVPFFGKIATNLTGLLTTLGENGLVGLIATAIIVSLFYRTTGWPIADKSEQALPGHKGSWTKGKRVGKSR